MTERERLDRLLEHELATAVSDIRGDQSLTQTLVDGTLTRVRQRRRRRATALTAVTSLGVAAGALVTWQLIDQAPSTIPAIQVPKIAPTYTFHQKFPDRVDPLAWARSLSRGSDPTEPYVAGHALVVDGQHIDLGQHTSVQLETTVPGGWVAEYSNRADDMGNQLDTRVGFVSRDGGFRAFSFMHEPRSGHQTMGFASSPDGTRVAYGGSIVDVATGAWVRYLPNTAASVQAWTTAGIAYTDSSGNNTIWRPGSSPRPSEWEFVSPETALQFSSEAALHYRHGCTAVGHLGDSLPVRAVAVICHEGVASVSDAGVAVTYTGRVVDLSSGRLLGRLPMSPPVDGIFGNQCCRFSWSADNRLIFEVGDGLLLRHSPLVSCDVDNALRCTRSSGWPAFPPSS